MTTSPTAASTPPFFTRYGFTRTGDPAAPLRIEPYPQICHRGALRATVVASAIDLVGGLVTREIAGVDATFTSDLSLRIPRPGIPDRLEVLGTRLRAGRRLVTTGVSLETTEGTYAYGETTFSRIARAAADAPDPADLATPESIPRHPLTQPLEDEVGVELVDASRGCIRLDLRPALLNPEGVMQGALVALAIECAALALAGPTDVVTELDLRYLSAASIGPVESQARFIGPAQARMLRVELRDVGREQRLTATALVRVSPPASTSSC